jgi:hypothetical protein
MEELFNLKETEASLFLKQKKTSSDGLLRPKLEDGKDGVRELTLRILPNLTREGKIGSTAIEKHLHYAKFQNNQSLSGYYDCLKNSNIGKDCPLCNTYWALKNTGNPNDEAKAESINRSTKYYCYTYVVEDKQVPENEGKIFIFPFGYKIYQKIQTAATRSRKPVNVEDLVYGANLNLIIQEVGGFYNYDASEFETPEPIEINGKVLQVGEDGTISKSETKRVKEFLLSREHDLEEFVAKDWTAVQYDNASKIVSVLTGTPYAGTSVVENETPETITSSAVFDDVDEDEDEVEDTPSVTKTETKTEAKTEAKAKAKVDTKPDVEVETAKKRAAAFFDDED